MSKRLFVAIDLPDTTNRALHEYAEVLRDVRWYKPSRYHLTLKFIGDTDMSDYAAIEESLGKISHAPFRLTIDKLGYFPPDRHPRVIWAGFEYCESLHHLQQKVEETLAELDIEKESREYIPHVTLGKNKGVPRTRVESFLDKRSDIYIPDIPVDSFILYSSELTPEGAVHTREKIYQLTE